MKKTLTKNEAISQGYTSYVFEDEGYQSLNDIHDFNEREPENRKAILVEKEPTYPSISEEQLKELIADQMECDWIDETHSDTNEVYELIMKMDFTEMAEKIKSQLKEITYYKGSDIYLIP